MLPLLLLFFVYQTANALVYPKYSTLTITQSQGVLNVTIKTDSEINFFNLALANDLNNLTALLNTNNPTKVVVFYSGNTDYFIGHVDLDSPITQDLINPDLDYASGSIYRLTQLPQTTIAVIEGRTRGIGSEFALSCDMRFASTPRTLLGQLEVPLGVLPGAGGVQYLSSLIGRAHAFEYILSGIDVDAPTAAQLGWINKAFPTSAALHAYVDGLAARIALFPLDAIAAAKRSINDASRPSLERLIADSHRFGVLALTPETQKLVGKFLAATNDQRNGSFEFDAGAEYPSLYE